MSSITGTLVDAQPLPVVQVDVVIDNPQTVTAWKVTRVSAQSTVDIRIKAETSGAESFTDSEAPIEIDFSYVLTVTRGTTPETVQSNTLRITGTRGCYLSDPFSGAAMSIEVQAWPDRLYKGRSAVLEVQSRSDPVVLGDVHTIGAGTWTLLTRTDARTEEMKALLTASGIVQLRTQPGSSIASVYAAVGDVDETRYTGSGADQRRLTDVNMQEIAPIPAAARDLGATLLGLSQLADTLEGLSLIRPTLLQLSQIRTG